MSEVSEFVVAAAKARERQQPGTSPEFDARMADAISAAAVTNPGHRPWPSAWIAACVALLVLGIVSAAAWVNRVDGSFSRRVSSQAMSLASPGSSSPECRRQFDESSMQLDGRCAWEVEKAGLSVQSWTRARVSEREDGVFVHEGLVVIDVEPVKPGEDPVRVGVAGGTIEVLGTRFVVYQGVAGGEVELIEGAIRFTRTDGRARRMAPGDRLRWSEATGDVGTGGETEAGTQPPAREAPPVVAGSAPVADEPKVTSARTKAKAKANAETKMTKAEENGETARGGEKGPSLNETLASIARLRDRGAFTEALSLIRDYRVGQGLSAATAEVLSFEEGSLIEAGRPHAEACRHWGHHQKRFGHGRYQAQVARHVVRLGCKQSDGQSSGQSSE